MNRRHVSAAAVLASAAALLASVCGASSAGPNSTAAAGTRAVSVEPGPAGTRAVTVKAGPAGAVSVAAAGTRAVSVEAGPAGGGPRVVTIADAQVRTTTVTTSGPCRLPAGYRSFRGPVPGTFHRPA
nr:hypothetical protein StreXyl84_75390 [Streptomyces sp. Xyl84]